MFLVVIGVFSKKLFEPNPRPLEYCYAIPFLNRQFELACPVNIYVSYFHGLVLSVKRSGDAR